MSPLRRVAPDKHGEGTEMSEVLILMGWTSLPLVGVALEGLYKARKGASERLADAQPLSAPPNLTCTHKADYGLQD